MGSVSVPVSVGLARSEAMDRCTNPSLTHLPIEAVRKASTRAMCRRLLRKIAIEAIERAKAARVQTRSAEPFRMGDLRDVMMSG